MGLGNPIHRRMLKNSFQHYSRDLDDGGACLGIVIIIGILIFVGLFIAVNNGWITVD